MRYMHVKGWFQETTKMNEIYHRRIQIGRQVIQTSRHRRMDIGTVLAADQNSYFMIGRQEK